MFHSSVQLSNKKLLFILITTVLALGLFFSPDIVGSAEADEPNTNSTLYFGDGPEGTSLYLQRTGTGLLDKFTKGENETWTVSGNTLTLNNFDYTLKDAAQYGLMTTIDTTLVLKGSNSITLAKRDGGDTYGIVAQDNLSISGEGSLTVNIGHTPNQSWGVYIAEANTTLTISEATVDVVLAEKPEGGDERRVPFGGLYGTNDTCAVIANGAVVSLLSTSNTSHSYGAYFSGVATRAPITVTGEGTSLIATAGKMAIKAGALAPEVDSSLGVYSNDQYNDGIGNTDPGNWVSTHGTYYVGERTPDTSGPAIARYIEMGEKPTFDTVALDYAVIGQPYSFQLQASGARSDEFQWSWNSRAVTGSADCLNVERSTGIASGMPAQLGPGTITISVNSRFGSSQKVFDFMVYSRAESHADSALNSVLKGEHVTGEGTTNDPFVVQANTEFSLMAVGDQQDMEAVVPGDTRFVATAWNMDSSGIFSTAPYLIKTTLHEAKMYTLTVTFREEAWDGSAWVPTGEIATKTSSVKAVAGPVVDPDKPDNPSDPNNPGNANDKDGTRLAKTGDHALIWMVGLMGMVLLSVVVLGLTKKRAGSKGADHSTQFKS